MPAEVTPEANQEQVFLYALRREVLRNGASTSSPGRAMCFYTPFGVRCFGTGARPRKDDHESFYTPFGVRCFGTMSAVVLTTAQVARFYTPFGVRCFGTIVIPPTEPDPPRFYTPFGVRCFGTATEGCGLREDVSGGFYTPFGVRWFGTLPPWTGR